MPFCPNCGTSVEASDAYCPMGGAPRVRTAADVPYAPYVPPRSDTDRVAMFIVILVVVVVVGTIAMSAALYVLVSGLLPAPVNAPAALGATLQKSADGTNWTLTTTYASPEIRTETTYLALQTSAGVPALLDTPLAALSGQLYTLSGNLGALYLHYESSAVTTVVPGDVLLIGTSTTTGTSTTGFHIQIAQGGTILYSSTLQ